MDAQREQRFREMADIPRPVTLPQQAYGGEPAWAPMDDRPAVWVWVQWTAGVATREAGHADGWTDRVVLVTLESGQWSLVVWRNAVTRRTVPARRVNATADSEEPPAPHP